MGRGPGYGLLALYAKAAVTCADWSVPDEPLGTVGRSGWSVRFAGFSLTRFDFAGLWFASLFDDDDEEQPGYASFAESVATLAAEAAILVATLIRFSVALTNVAFTGSSGLVMRIDGGWRSDCRRDRRHDERQPCDPRRVPGTSTGYLTIE